MVNDSTDYVGFFAGDFFTGELMKEEQTQSPAVDSGRGTSFKKFFKFLYVC